MDHGLDSGHRSSESTGVSTVGSTEGDVVAFVGHFARNEAQSALRARVDAAIEQAIAPLSWPARVVMRPTLRFVAELPEWLSIELQGSLLVTTFSSGISLGAELGGPARRHQLPAAVRGNVRHFWDAGRLCTEIVSDVGTIRNTLERLSSDELLGHAHLASQYVPLPVRYSMRLRRAPEKRL